ncbi:MAG TPA: nucleoside-triphosphatase, partial [Streptosporangiaceae bacterium]|nr:nucleoside-triphosphatase [Streptosporangiaceae bacterium]
MDEQAIFITGPPGVGKSSCLERLARDCDDLLIDGVISGEMRRDGKRAGFEMRLISSGASGVLASPDIESEIRFGTLRESDGEPRLGVSHDFLRDIVCPHLRAV